MIATFDPPNVGGVNTCPFGEFGLRNSEFGAARSDGAPKTFRKQRDRGGLWQLVEARKQGNCKVALTYAVLNGIYAL